MRAWLIRLAHKKTGPESEMEKGYADEWQEYQKSTPAYLAVSRDGCAQGGAEWNKNQQQVQNAEDDQETGQCFVHWYLPSSRIGMLNPRDYIHDRPQSNRIVTVRIPCFLRYTSKTLNPFES